jgi:translation initiation factor IF-3
MQKPTPANKVKGPENKVNSQITAIEVRVISETGEQLGVMPIRQAIQLAQDQFLDLVEISPTANPPVCRIIDFGKFKYQFNQKAKETKKKQVVIEVKEINLTPNTDVHDIETKANHIKRWLKDKCRIKVSVKFRGREMAYIDKGYVVIDALIAAVGTGIVKEGEAKLEGRRLSITLVSAPLK